MIRPVTIYGTPRRSTTLESTFSLRVGKPYNYETGRGTTLVLLSKL